MEDNNMLSLILYVLGATTLTIVLIVTAACVFIRKKEEKQNLEDKYMRMLRFQRRYQQYVEERNKTGS